MANLELGCMTVQWLMCWTASKSFGVQTPARAEIWFEISALPVPPSQLSYDEDETVRERTGHPLSCAEAKKLKSLTFHIHGCHRACSSCPAISGPALLLLLYLQSSYITSNSTVIFRKNEGTVTLPQAQGAVSGLGNLHSFLLR